MKTYINYNRNRPKKHQFLGHLTTLFQLRRLCTVVFYGLIKDSAQVMI